MILPSPVFHLWPVLPSGVQSLFLTYVSQVVPLAFQFFGVSTQAAAKRVYTDMTARDNVCRDSVASHGCSALMTHDMTRHRMPRAQRPDSAAKIGSCSGSPRPSSRSESRSCAVRMRMHGITVAGIGRAPTTVTQTMVVASKSSLASHFLFRAYKKSHVESRNGTCNADRFRT